MDGRIYRGGKPGSATDASTLGAAARQCSRCCDARRTVGPCTVGACTERCTVGACTERERAYIATSSQKKHRTGAATAEAPAQASSAARGACLVWRRWQWLRRRCDRRRRGTTSSKTISSNFHSVARKLDVAAFSLQARLGTPLRPVACYLLFEF